MTTRGLLALLGFWSTTSDGNFHDEDLDPSICGGVCCWLSCDMGRKVREMDRLIRRLEKRSYSPSTEEWPIDRRLLWAMSGAVTFGMVFNFLVGRW